MNINRTIVLVSDNAKALHEAALKNAVKKGWLVTTKDNKNH